MAVSTPKKILICAGTRPEVIKLAPVIHALAQQPETFAVRLCSTGQHREMLDHILSDFELVPDVNLAVMTEAQSLAELTSRLFKRFDALLADELPDMILVQGDTTSVMVAALCAFYRRIPCGHVEAGLRTGNIHAPFPEEVNRRVAGMVADLHFAPTEKAAVNLRTEGVSDDKIIVTGNTVIDALLWMAENVIKNPPLLSAEVSRALERHNRLVLVTGHRRESFGQGFENICLALVDLAKRHSDTLFVYPVHLNPRVREPVFRLLRGIPNLMLCEPLSYSPFVYLLQRCTLALTDSGGVQEEGPALKKPVVVMRDITERPEGVEAGFCVLVGTDRRRIADTVSAILNNVRQRAAMTTGESPYGDGQAARRIVDALRSHFIHGRE